MKTIVCFVDDSPGSAAAVQVAAELAGRLSVRLVLAHVTQRARLSEQNGRPDREQALHLLDRVAHEHGLDGTVDRRAEVGDPAAELARIAVEEAAALILVGAPSQSWARVRLS